jgi:hypothetical protein
MTDKAATLRVGAACERRLLFRLRRFIRIVHERFYPIELLHETGLKIMHAILEEHDEAEGEKEKKGKPKKPSNQRHASDASLETGAGQSSGGSAPSFGAKG